MGSRQVKPRGTGEQRQDDRPGSSYRGHRHQARGETWLGSLLMVHVRQEHRGHHGEDSHVLAAHHCLLHHLLHLAGFWLLCLFIFYQFIEDHQPRWQQDGGLIGRSPALGVRPGQDDSIIESSVIIFNHDNPNDDENIPGYKQWVERLDEYLKPYRAEPANENGLDCASDAAATDGKFCKFDLTKLGPCGQKNTNYGFDSDSTCLVLKLNKIFGLEHEYYDNPDELPEEMPSELKERIKAAVAGGKAKQVWVSCKAEFPADKEGIKSIDLFPTEGGFPSQFFPYKKQDGYQSPLVAVRINEIKPGQLIHVECRAWAKNINYNRRDRVGIVRFEVMNHNSKTTEEVNKLN